MPRSTYALLYHRGPMSRLPARLACPLPLCDVLFTALFKSPTPAGKRRPTSLRIRRLQEIHNSTRAVRLAKQTRQAATWQRTLRPRRQATSQQPRGWTETSRHPKAGATFMASGMVACSGRSNTLSAAGGRTATRPASASSAYTSTPTAARQRCWSTAWSVADCGRCSRSMRGGAGEPPASAGCPTARA